MSSSYSAQVSSWANKTKARMEAIHKTAVQRTIELMQEPGPSVASSRAAAAAAGKRKYGPFRSGGSGHMPIDTGFLRASGQAFLGEVTPPSRTAPQGVQAFTYDEGQVDLVVSRAKIEQPITFAYTAAYARKMEYRYGFVRLAAQQWQQTVAAAEAEAKARAGA